MQRGDWNIVNYNARVGLWTVFGFVGALAVGACSDDDADESVAPLKDAGTPSKQSGATSATTHRAARSRMLPTVKDYLATAPWFNVYRPEDLDATGAKLPVIAWANGGCYRSDFTWEPLFKRWAAGGFVVLALTADPEKGEMTQSSIADQAGLVDWAVAAASGEYEGKLDTQHMVAAGNSCGGVTALGLAAQDPRLHAVFVLSGSSGFGAANRAVIDKISVPVGYVVGGPQDIAGANATSDYDALPADVPAMIVSRFEGDHRTVSTDPAILAEEAEIALNWMDLALYGSHEAYDELSSERVCAGCEPGHYKLKSKHLETLKQ